MARSVSSRVRLLSKLDRVASTCIRRSAPTTHPVVPRRHFLLGELYRAALDRGHGLAVPDPAAAAP